MPDGEDRAPPGPAALAAVMGAHHEAWMDLLGRATGRDSEWLGRLSDGDGSALSIAMWEANGPFFVRLVVAAIAGRENLDRLFRSLTSSASSSGPDTPTSPNA